MAAAARGLWARYPRGEHLNEAKELLAILPNPDSPGGEAPELTCERLTTHPNDETIQFPGVPAARLRENLPAAIEACRAAHSEFPTIHKYTSFLARALYLGGEIKEAIALFTEAADAGNIRAMTTLGAIYETGTGPSEILARQSNTTSAPRPQAPTMLPSTWPACWRKEPGFNRIFPKP